LFLLAANFTALSFLAYYYRIIQNTSIHWFKYALHAALFINISSWLVFFIMSVFQCNPISAFWTFPAPATAHCIDDKIVTFGGCLCKLFIDIMITTLPIPLILRMNLSRGKKYAVVTLIALGYVVTAAGAIRTYYAYVIFWKTYDATWYYYWCFLAAAVENDLAITCACAPAIKPLFVSLFSRAESQMSSKTPKRFSRGNSVSYSRPRPRPSEKNMGSYVTSLPDQQRAMTSGLRASELDIEKGQESRGSVNPMEQFYFKEDYEEKFCSGNNTPGSGPFSPRISTS
jgi:hypothetical protein